ncbi:MAG: hypothetical protein ACJ74L_03650 [Gaiellaceae bacterium]
MRKLFVLALAVVALCAAVPAGADPVGGVQPACADIIGDLGAHSVSENTVFGGIRTMEPTCNGITYTVVVSYTEGGVQKFAFFSTKGSKNDLVTEEGNGLIKYQITGVHSDTVEVCAAYFSTRGNKVLDAVPDTAESVAPPTPTPGAADPCPGWMTFAGSPGGSFPYN